MELLKNYVDINDTLRYLRLQVAESKPYAREHCPIFSDPADLYRWMQDRTTYKNDPKDRELLQTMETLFNGDYWGIPGMGDCDCFTIASLACIQQQGWGVPIWIKLAGRSPLAPVHIWAGVDWKKKEYALDLTEKQPQKERHYPYVQKIFFRPV